MKMTHTLHIIMPVKDAVETCTQALNHLLPTLESPQQLTIYNDFSAEVNSARLQQMAMTYGCNIVHWAEHTQRPSPNYLLTLQDAQAKALAAGAHLLVVESDVLVSVDTVNHLLQAVNDKAGMVAAVTVDRAGVINFPYLYARKMKGACVATRKRLSFCCTLLTNNFLSAYDFQQLDSSKNWYDVFISHKSVELGFVNYLLLDTPVVHLPHSSRPWKQMKYTNPLRYYWRKLTQRLDKI